MYIGCCRRLVHAVALAVQHLKPLSTKRFSLMFRPVLFVFDDLISTTYAVRTAFDSDELELPLRQRGWLSESSNQTHLWSPNIFILHS